MHHHQREWVDRQHPPYNALHTGEAYAGVRAWMTIWLSVRVCLVRAQNGYAGHLLNSGQPRHDRALR